MSEFKISKTITADALGRSSGAPKYPFLQMEVARVKDGKLIGDSFLIPGKTIRQVSGNLYGAAKEAGVAIAIRSFPDGVRVFRVKKEG